MLAEHACQRVAPRRCRCGRRVHLGRRQAQAGHQQLSSGQTEALVISQTIPGLDKSLAGQKAGSRLLLAILPKDGFGPTGSQSLGVTGSDTLVFVVDVLGGYRRRPQRTASPQSASDPKLPSVSSSPTGAAPPVTIPKAPPPGTLQAETLIQGTGPPVAKGKLLVAQYEGLIWRTGKVFDSSWQRGLPAAFVIGTGKVPGWDKTLVGQRVGSRVLLVIPPKDGYGAQGDAVGPHSTAAYGVSVRRPAAGS